VGKKSRSESGIRIRMNIPDCISESLETKFFGLKILKFFDADSDLFDPGSGMEKFGSESTTLSGIK
jgi:hypothetical protein